MKILTIIGARPQFIKASVVSHALAKHPSFEEIILHTGQHYDPNMSDIFFDQLHIPRPAFKFDLSSSQPSLQLAEIITHISHTIEKTRPDFIMVYGDTTSTLAGALAANKTSTKLIHVEAGLRSFNMKMPEEVNRKLTDAISDILLVPSESAERQLKSEGTKPQAIVSNVGDVMHDSTLFFSGKSSEMKLDFKDYALCTLHRAENTDDLKTLASLLRFLARLSQTLPIVFPIHPRTRKILQNFSEVGALVENSQVKLIDPVGYMQMLTLLKNSQVLLTDSGGMQKEAFYLNVPCVTLRTETEWIETVESGKNILVPPLTAENLEISDLFRRIETARKIPLKTFPYGKGDSAQKIVKVLETLKY